jgi:hypothetical protein
VTRPGVSVVLFGAGVFGVVLLVVLQAVAPALPS